MSSARRAASSSGCVGSPRGHETGLKQDIASELGLSREDPYVNLSIHTAPDVRPFPWQSCQWAKSVGFTRRSRSNQSRAPLVLRRNRLNLRRAQSVLSDTRQS